MGTQTIISNVSDTAYWVAYYRAKETERKDALFQDPLAKNLMGDLGQQISEQMAKVSRYTEWSVVSRTIIIDRYIEKLVRDGVDAVVNLGAGLDTRPYRMDLPESLEWVEADQVSIIAHKNIALQREKPKCKLTRVAVDLAEPSLRRKFLDTVVPGAKKVLVMTEGVIPYLSPEQVSELGSDLHARERFQYWITEYFHPRVYRHLQSALRTKHMKNAPFRFYPPDWFGFFKKVGWVEKETQFAGEIAVEFKRRPPMPAWATLIFPLFPKKIKQQARRMVGYSVLEREPR